MVDKKQVGGVIFIGSWCHSPALFSWQSRNPISCHLFPEYHFLRQFCISCQDFEASTSWVAVKFRIPSINFVLSRIPHHISGQIVDPEIPPLDPVYGDQYILVFPPAPPPLISLASKLLERQYPWRLLFEGTIFLITWRHDSDSTNTHKTISESN